MNFNVAELERLTGLARRAHDGTVDASEIEINGLPYKYVCVLLTDMGTPERPFKTFRMTPKGILEGGLARDEARA